MQAILKKITWNWDRSRNLLWWNARFTDGQKISVGIPLARVAATFYEELEKPDIQAELEQTGALEILGCEFMGTSIQAPETVDEFLEFTGGLWGSIKKSVGGAVKSAAKATGLEPVRKAAARAQGKLSKGAWKVAKETVKYTRKAAESKYVGAGMLALSVACPAVGGPALAAWTVANRVNAKIKDAEKTVNDIKKGIQVAESTVKQLTPADKQVPVEQLTAAERYARGQRLAAQAASRASRKAGIEAGKAGAQRLRDAQARVNREIQHLREIASKNTPESRMLVAALRTIPMAETQELATRQRFNKTARTLANLQALQ